MRIAWIFLLFLAFSPVVIAQSDPLNSTFKPVMDTTCTDYPSNVWVSGPLWKIRQDAGTAPTCSNGMVENGKWGTFYGTQNEFVDFQVHWHDTGSTTVGLKVTVSNFAQTVPNPSTISCATGIGEKCIVYREQYMHITFPDCTGSPAGYCYNVPGFYPDILEPAVDPYLGQTTNAFPFTVAANQNQSMWVDVLIPPNAPSGYYSGTVTVCQNAPAACTAGNLLATLPITIGVWQWPAAQGGSMPSKPTLKSYFAQPWFSQQCKAFFGSTSCAGYPINGTPGFNADAATTAAALDECITLMDHRVGCNGESDQYSVAGVYGTTANFTSTYSPILNGTSTSPHPLTLLSGAATNSWNWSAAGIPTPTQQQTAATLFSTNSWFPKMFYYYCDETACSAATLVSTGNTIHSQSTPIMPTFTTKTGITTVASQGALNAVDIIVADIRFDDPPSAYTSWLAGNCCGAGSPPRQTWGYQTCDDGAGPCTNGQTGTGTFPGYSTDNTPATNQAMEWFSYKNGKSGELYFAVSICPAQPGGQLCGQGGFPASTGDPTVSNYHQGMWGDGTMLYEVPASKWGVTTPIFIPSMRLKYVRDGMQNYEYMNVLKQNGKDATVQAAINSWITNVTTVNWNSTAPAFGFSSDLQDARIVLGNAMHALSFTAPWSGILASSRAINWSLAGVTTGANPQTGALPSDSWTQCGTTIAPYTGTAATISSAITACSGLSQYVLLGPGTFTLSTGITFANANHVELRGSGSDQTFIKMNGQDACTGINAGICIGSGIAPQSASTQPRSTNAADLTGTVEGGAGVYPANAQGLTVANIGNAGGGIHQGQFITVDQAGAGTTGAGLNDCTDFSIQNNGCNEENASTGNRIVPSSIGVGIPVNVTVGVANSAGCPVSANIVALVTSPVQAASFSVAWVNMISTMYLGGLTGTPTQVTIASVQSTTCLTLASPPPGGNGSYSMSLYSPVTGTLTQSTGAFHATTGAVFSQAFVGQAMDLMANNTLFPVKVLSVSGTTDLVFAATPALPVDGTYAIKSLYHSQSQMVQVTNLTGTGCTGVSPNIVCTGAGPFTLTVTPGLYGPNWSTLKGPGIWFATWPHANYDGVSDLSMDLTNSTNAVNGVLFINANNSWVKNYRSINGITSHIEFIGSAHNTVQSCYLYGTRNASTQSYGVEHFNGGDNLVHNCIFQHVSSGMIVGHSFGSVFANNYSHDNYGPSYGSTAITITNTSQSGTTQTYTFTGADPLKPLSGCVNFCVISIAGTTNPNGPAGAFNHTNLKWASASSGTSGTFTITVPTSATINSAAEANAVALAATSVMDTAIVLHDPAVNYTLFEGNIGAGMFADVFHGHANLDTWFRNYFTGYESNKSSATIAAKITPLSRYQNFIGNLLGDNQTGYKGLANVIYYLAPEDITQNAKVLADPLVNTTSMFWGNYDTFTGATRFCGPGAPGFSSPPCSSVSEVPTTDAFGYANTVPSSLTLPASLFYSAAPTYNQTPQGTVPFPAIGPDVTATNAPGTVGIAIAPDLVVPANLAPANHAWNNAAELCYQNSPIDSSYPLGMDRGVLLFNAANCYGSSSPVNPSAVLSPNPLAFGNQNVNTTSAVQFSTLANIGTVNLNVTATSITGNFTRSGGTCPTGSFTLPPFTGNTCTIGVTFSPNATGPFTGTISVTSNAVPSPTVANLTGTGTQATITWSSPQGGTAYNFGNIPVSSSINSSNLTLQNTGTGPLSVAVTITGANTAQFSIISTTCSSPLAAGSSCTYVVRFTATAATTYTASLTETDSNASNSPQSLTMSGSGFIPVVNPVVPWPAIIIQ